MRKPKQKNRSNSSKQSGNTKQIAPSKNWCFTLNNYNSDDIQAFTTSESSIVPKYVFQEEIGENGTPHLQGYLQFATKKRPKSIFENKTIHWEKTRNVKKSIEYCQKEDTRNGEIYYRGIQPPYKIKIRNWAPWMTHMHSIINGEPSERKIYWIWENMGNRGKTVFCKWVYQNCDRAITLSGKAHDMKNAIVQYVEKNNMYPKTIIINVPRHGKDYFSYSGVEVIKDMFFYSGKYEGGMVCGPNPHVIVTANSEPEIEMMSKDRWKIINI